MNDGLSQQLKASIVGYNGTKAGRNASDLIEFYNLWLKMKSRKNPSIAKEAEQKKEQVLILIRKLFKGKMRTRKLFTPVKAQQIKVKKIKKDPSTVHAGVILEPTDELDIYFTDGGTSNNGLANQCSRICIVKNGEVLIDEEIGNKTNNEAEYVAVIKAIEAAGNRKAVIYSDSQLIVYTVNGVWEVKKDHLKLLRDEAREKLGVTQLLWLRRNKNKAGQYLEQKYQI